jgi:uncharacterized cupredoxin-like copper-binding protein
MNVKLLTGIVAAAVALGVSGVAVASSSAPSHAASTTPLRINEKQWVLLFSHTSLVHGRTYLITVKNIGTIKHSLLIDGPGVSDRGIHNATALSPGASRSFAVRFPHAGSYRFYCAIRGHAARGMQRTIHVK